MPLKNLKRHGMGGSCVDPKRKKRRNPALWHKLISLVPWPWSRDQGKQVSEVSFKQTWTNMNKHEQTHYLRPSQVWKCSTIFHFSSKTENQECLSDLVCMVPLTCQGPRSFKNSRVDYCVSQKTADANAWRRMGYSRSQAIEAHHGIHKEP